MEKNSNDVMVGDNKDGVEKADKENYAFFMESTSIKYETERRCNLHQVGNLLDDKGYGIAMRKSLFFISFSLKKCVFTILIRCRLILSSCLKYCCFKIEGIWKN